MGLGRAFKKIGRGFLKGLKITGKIASKIDDIPGVGEVLVFIPVAGPAISAAVKRVAQAEEMFSDRQSTGQQKLDWVLSQLKKDLRDLGIEEKRSEGLVLDALRLIKGEAVIQPIKAERAKKGKDSPSKPEPDEPGGPTVTAELETSQPDPSG